MTVKLWPKIGLPEILAQSDGRSLVRQKYRDPHTNEVSSFGLFQAEGFSCVVLAVTEDQKVLAIRQFRPSAEAVILELPAGRCKYPEQKPEAVAREEVAEETGGYEPDIVIPLTKKVINLEPAYSKHLFYPFLFMGCRKTDPQAKPDKGEYIETEEIPLSEWIEMCHEGKFLDPKSMVTTMLALKYLGYQIGRQL